jgi:hypothetical protein
MRRWKSAVAVLASVALASGLIAGCSQAKPASPPAGSG